MNDEMIFRNEYDESWDTARVLREKEKELTAQWVNLDIAKRKLTGAEKGKITRKQKPIEVEMNAVRARINKAPPAPKSPATVMERIMQKIACIQKDCQAALDKFQESFDVNPVYALEWYSGDVVESQFYSSLIKRYELDRVTVETLPQDLYSLVSHILKRNRESLLNYSPKRSTNSYTNSIAQDEMAARARMEGPFSSHSIKWIALELEDEWDAMVSYRLLNPTNTQTP